MGVPGSADTPLPEPVEALLGVACAAPLYDAGRFRAALPEARIIAHDVRAMGADPGRAETTLLIADGRRITVGALFPRGRLRRLTIEVRDTAPRLSLTIDPACAVREMRRVDYDPDGRARLIRVFGPDLETATDEIPLNPPVPNGTDPGGITVGLIDSGINYLISPFRDRLARNTDGSLIGLDLWDGDVRPFDIDTARSPFFPLHHGSAVASILIREAPMARVIAVRYPRPDMARMADAVNFLARNGARVVNLAMGSNRAADWRAFEKAARTHPEMLFVVSAGNDGRDIDADPVYPAALELPNTLVVTSSELDGRLARGSNWGPRHVDVMVPGERIEVIDHRGAPGKASGSSFAVPRVTALALRLLAASPEMTLAELRGAILDRARPVAGRPLVGHGWIPDPTDGP